MKSLFLSLVFLAACAPANLDDLRCEADGEMKKLSAELRKLETSEDVQKASRRLKKHFNKIADLLAAAKHFPLAEAAIKEGSAAGEELFSELARLYEIPGARAAIEAAQGEAVHRLDMAR